MSRDPNLSQLYDYSNLNVQKTKHKKYEDTYPITNPMDIVDKHTLLGIEIEVENMQQLVEDPVYYWEKKHDGSLRNHGLEFTSIPLRTEQVEHALNYYTQLVTKYNTPDYSPRTSVHVHMNVRDMTEKEVINFVLLYCLFEKHFFHIAGTKRESSIFCVPLYKTLATYKLSNIFKHITSWHKYNALNLGTVLGTHQLPKYGTIEFRHLYGTGDKRIIINWINNILLLKQAAKKWDTLELLQTIKNLNTTSEYVQMYQDIFGPYGMYDKMAKYDFESCVSFVKSWEWGFDFVKTLPISDNSVYYTQYKQKETYKTAEGTLQDNNKIIFKGQQNGWQLVDNHVIINGIKVINYTNKNLMVEDNLGKGPYVKTPIHTYLYTDNQDSINEITSKMYTIVGIDFKKHYELIYLKSIKYGFICMTHKRFLVATNKALTIQSYKVTNPNAVDEEQTQAFINAAKHKAILDQININEIKNHWIAYDPTTDAILPQPEPPAPIVHEVPPAPPVKKKKKPVKKVANLTATPIGNVDLEW